MLKVEKLNVCFGNIKILWDINFEVKKGNIVALVGSNAAGKTTIMKAIMGLIKPIQGRIIFNGKNIENFLPYKIVSEGISLIPENRRLFADMTVLENLELGAFIINNSKVKLSNLKKIYNIFPILKERQKQLAKTLSGGEQQMVAIARGLMACPKLCIFDEPSLGLSPLVTNQLFSIIKELNADGMTILLAEQNVMQTLKIADYAYVLENGRITLEGYGYKLLNDAHVKKAYLGI